MRALLLLPLSLGIWFMINNGVVYCFIRSYYGIYSVSTVVLSDSVYSQYIVVIVVVCSAAHYVYFEYDDARTCMCFFSQDECTTTVFGMH